MLMYCPSISTGTIGGGIFWVISMRLPTFRHCASNTGILVPFVVILLSKANWHMTITKPPVGRLLLPLMDNQMLGNSLSRLAPNQAPV